MNIHFFSFSLNVEQEEDVEQVVGTPKQSLLPKLEKRPCSTSRLPVPVIKKKMSENDLPSNLLLFIAF